MKSEYLFDRYLRSELTAGECRELKRRLREEPETARTFVEHVNDTGLMVRVASQMELAGEKPQPVTARRIRWLAPLAAAASLLVAAGVWLWNAERGVTGAEGEVVARVEKVSGAGVSAFAEATADRTVAGKELKAGDEVRAGARIETGRDGTVRLAWLGEKTEVEIGQDSVCTVEGSGKSQLLEHGRLTATVGKQVPGKRFVVRTPQAQATVLGTKFSLLVSAAPGNVSETSSSNLDLPAFPFTRLDVVEGLVQLSRLADGVSLDIPAGFMALAGQDLALKPYPAGTEYVDGEVLFADSFSEGLEGYNILSRTSEAQPEVQRPYNQRDADLSRLVRLGETFRDGQKTRYVAIDAINAGASAGIALQTPTIRMGNVVMEYDVLVERDYANPGRQFIEITPTAGTVTDGKQRDTRSEKVRIPTRTWSRNRIEHTIRVDQTGKAWRSVVYKWNGVTHHEAVAELPDDNWKAPDSMLTCRIDIGGMRVQVANYAIRRLVRAPVGAK